MKQGIIQKYRKFLSLPEHTIPLTLGEGDTPLLEMPRLRDRIGAKKFYIKFEGQNPTGSFKDRGMATAVGEAVGRSVRIVLCASTGNTAASAAAYAAHAGMQAIVLLPEGKVARGKLAAAAMHGARIIQIKGSFDAALALVREAAQTFGLELVNSLNPYRLEGQKTAAFEICDELGDAPNVLAIPVGNAGNITAYAIGFEQYKKGIPELLGVQASGAAPLVGGHPIEKPETIATAIRIGNPARGTEAVRAVQKSGGKFLAVSDKNILEAQQLLAQEGIWCEPSSAAGVAGLLKEVTMERSFSNMRVVAVCTGHGLKDPDVVSVSPFAVIEPKISALKKLLRS